MRIGVVYDCLFPIDTGGGERVYRAMADQFHAKGHEVTYITRFHQGGYSDVPFHVDEVARGPLYDAAGGRTAGGAVRFSWGVARYLVRHRGNFDLLVVSALPVITLLAARAATLGSRTTIVADWLEVWPRRKWREYSGAVVGTVASVLQWIGARATQHNTVNSRFTAERLSAVNPRSAPVVLGLFDLHAVALRMDPADEPPTALFVGRWIPDKRVDRLPAAILRARRRVPELHCVIVGGGTEEGAIRAAITAVGGESFIQVLGRVDDDELDQLMSRAAVLVNPSAREGFGLVLTESAARGVPFVVVEGEDNAAAELVVPGTNGFLAADPSDTSLGNAIADAVLAGSALRVSTAKWFIAMRAENTLSRSTEVLLELAAKSTLR